MLRNNGIELESSFHPKVYETVFTFDEPRTCVKTKAFMTAYCMEFLILVH